jgi:type IV pilus secretin PilQ/predicted competence protein
VRTPSSSSAPVSVDAKTAVPSIAALPLESAPAQAAQPKTQRRDQLPPPPAPAARERGAQARPAAEAAQQKIQIDPNGLITMHVNELDVRQLLEFLSRRSGLNILVSPRVSGTITANFERVSLERVLPAVIKLANLVEKKEGPIHYIYSRQDLQDEAEVVKRERILTKVYRLNYVRADEMLAIIRPFLSTDVGRNRVSVTPSYRFGISESNTFVAGGAQAMTAGAAAGGGMTGGGGVAGVTGGGATVGGYQPPTGANSLADSDQIIIQDYESNLKIVDQIIAQLDVRPVQVLIEAVIISVDLEHDKELGVNFAVVDNLAQLLGTVGTGTALNGNVGFTPTQLLTAAGKIAQGTVPDPQGFTSASNGIKFGFVATNVTGFVRALETIGSTKILASPRILVLNKQRAEIQLGARLGFQTLSQNFTSTIQQVQFLNVGTLLRLRPFVSSDGMVRLEIHPERSSGVVNNNLPSAQTAELTTNVMVPDGATLVIGGLMEDEDDFNMQGLPGLSKIPVLGYLFGNRVKNEGRRELVVLLTPHIWSPDQAMAHAPSRVSEAEGSGAPALPDAVSGREPPARVTAPAARASSSTPASAPAAAQAAVLPLERPRTGGPSGPSDKASASAAGDRTGQAALRRRAWLSSLTGFARAAPQPPSVDNGGPGRRGANSASEMPGQSRAAARSVAPRETRNTPPLVLNTPPPGAVAALSGHTSDDMVHAARWELHSDWDRQSDAGSGEPRSESRTTGVTSASRSQSGVQNGAPRRHTVTRRETFETIARLYYGSARYEKALWWANRGKIAWPERLAAGDVIVIPSAHQLDALQVPAPGLPAPRDAPAP